QPSEERIALRNIRWETYESLLVDLADCSAPRLTYDRGTLEIMSPFAEHEVCNHTLALLVELIAEERDLDLANLGCTTFKREDLAILALAGGGYHESNESVSLPGLDRGTLSAFTEASKSLKRPEWVRRVRDWARHQTGSGDPQR